MSEASEALKCQWVGYYSTEHRWQLGPKSFQAKRRTSADLVKAASMRGDASCYQLRQLLQGLQGRLMSSSGYLMADNMALMIIVEVPKRT